MTLSNQKKIACGDQGTGAYVVEKDLAGEK